MTSSHYCEGCVAGLLADFHKGMFSYLLAMPYIHAARLKNDLVKVRIYGYDDDDRCCILRLRSQRDDIMDDIISYWIVAVFVLRDASSKSDATALRYARMMYIMSLRYFPSAVSRAYGQSVERTLSMFHLIKPLNGKWSIRRLYEYDNVMYVLDRYVDSGLTDLALSLAASPFARDEDARAVQSFRQRNPGFDPGHFQRDLDDFVMSLELSTMLCTYGM